MRNLLYILMALVALSTGAFIQHWLNAAPKDEPTAAIDPATAFPDLQAKLHRLDEWKGKVMVVNFWATWCPPCLEEMPEFVKLQNDLGGQGVQFIGIAIDDAKAVGDFLASRPVNYPILIGEDSGDDFAARLGNRMGILPFSAVIDRSGKLIHVEPGTFERDEILKVVAPYLGTGAQL